MYERCIEKKEFPTILSDSHQILLGVINQCWLSMSQKPLGETNKPSSAHIQPAKTVAEEDDDDDEDLEALRLAALQSKKEAGSTSHVSPHFTQKENITQLVMWQ